MKYLILGIFSLAGLSAINGAALVANDVIRGANNRNEKQTVIDNGVADFLTKIADARMMGMKEGKLAVKKGTTKDIVDYGKLMIKDQAFLLSKVKKLAADRKIILPREISDDKKDGFEDLNKKNGVAFDKKFIKMMKIDHKRDIKYFKEAIDLDDKGVSAFASKYLSLIQFHLDKLNEIKGKQ